MPFVKVNNLKVYYETYGDGEPLILLHHGFGCGKIWKAIYPRLVVQGYKVVIYDQAWFWAIRAGR